MADWEAFRSELESGVGGQPPLEVLRERRRRRQQRKAIAGTFAVVMAGSATGLAILGEGGRNGAPPPSVAALNPVVTSTKLPPPPDYKEHVVTDVDFVSERTGWALGLRCVGDRCDVATWRTDDGGRTWSEPSPVATAVPRTSYHEEDPRGGGVRSIRMVDARVGYAFNPDLYVTRDGARTWTRLARESKVTSISVAGTSVWVTERGCDAGVDCDLVVSGGQAGGDLARVGVPETNGAPALVRRAGERDGYVVTWNASPGDDATFWRTADGGRTWAPARMPCPDATAVAVSARADSGVTMVCTNAAGKTAFATHDHGTRWRPMGEPPAEGVVTDLVGYHLATQTPGAIYEYVTDGGWVKQDVAKAYGYGNLDVLPRSPDGARPIFAMGDAGQLWTTADGGWARLALPPGAPRQAPAPPARGLRDESVAWTDVSFVDARQGWAVGDRCGDGGCALVVRRTDDGGETWRDTAVPDTREARGRGWDGPWSVAFADARTGWVTGHGLYETRDGGGTWRRVTSDPVHLNPSSRGGAVWAVVATQCELDCAARVYRGTAAGGMRPVPGTPPVGAPTWMAAVDAERAYLLGSRSSVTADGGRTWRPLTPPPCATVTAASAFAPNGLWAVCAGPTGDDVQRQAVSTDGGRTWRTSDLVARTQDLSEIVAFSETYAWRTGPTRGVLVTRDGGRTWDAAPNVADRATGLTFADERHGWLVAGHVLYRTTDGRTWERVG